MLFDIKLSIHIVDLCEAQVLAWDVPMLAPVDPFLF